MGGGLNGMVCTTKHRVFPIPPNCNLNPRVSLSVHPRFETSPVAMPRGGRGGRGFVGGVPRQTWGAAAYAVWSDPLPLDLAVFVAALCAWAVSAVLRAGAVSRRCVSRRCAVPPLWTGEGAIM